MKHGFIAGIFTGFILTSLGAGSFIATHKIVAMIAQKKDTPLPVPAYAAAPGNKECAPVYFATTVDGKITRLTPLNERYLMDSALVSWVAQATTSAMSFGFNDWMESMRKNAIHFSAEGWQEFHNALAAEGIGAKTVERKEVLTSTPARAPVIRQQGVKDGIYRWAVEQPIISTLAAANNSATATKKYTIFVTLQRAQDLTKPAGVEISSFRLVSTAE